jgi:hypothetical protein
MADIKSEIIAWFNGPQDFDEGILLLKRVSKKDKVLGKLIKRGESRSSFEKLVWELNKTAGLKKIPVPTAKVESKIVKVETEVPAAGEKKAVKRTEKKKGSSDEKTKYSLIGDREISTFPDVIQKLVRENSTLYMQRGKKHAELVRLGESNDAEVIEKRTGLVDKIKEISDRLEVLYGKWKEFEEKGVVPDPVTLWPEPAAKKAEKKVSEMPATIEALKSRKKNIQSSVTKDRNLLLYGTKTKPKSGKESPMPAGPKRTTLEKRIAKKEKEIIEIDQQIADRG